MASLSIKIMATERGHIGTPCALPTCGKFLSSPTISLNCPNGHSLHEMCADKVFKSRESKCPSCEHTFTVGKTNPVLEDLIWEIDCLVTGLKHSDEPILQRLFHKAVSKDKVDIAQILLAQNPSLASSMHHGRTALYDASQKGYPGMAKMLLDAGADPLKQNNLSYSQELNRYWSARDMKFAHEETPVGIAAREGHVEILKLFRSREIPLNQTTLYGRTPLHQAIQECHEEAALYLIAETPDLASLDIKDAFGHTPISFAARQELSNVVQELMNRGIPLPEGYVSGTDIEASSEDSSSTAPAHIILTPSEPEQLILSRIANAMRAAGLGEDLFLIDLKEKASNSDDWTPKLNFVCNNVAIMREYELIDLNGHMPDLTKKIVEKCVVVRDSKTVFEPFRYYSENETDSTDESDDNLLEGIDIYPPSDSSEEEEIAESPRWGKCTII